MSSGTAQFTETENTEAFWEEISRAFMGNRMILFAGSGASSGGKVASYQQIIVDLQQKFPSIPKEPGMSEDEYLLRLQNSSFIHEYREFIKNRFTCHEVSITESDPPVTITKKVPHVPNQKHMALVKLFGELDRIKIITTNFDVLLEEAVRREYDGLCCPVKTLGQYEQDGEVSGIVHIHGSIHDTSDKLILTRADFGYSYIGHADVRRSLVAKYLGHIIDDGRYSILVVGMGCSDPMFDYFFNTIDKRKFYALVPEPERQKWLSYGLNHITFPVPEVTTPDGTIKRDYSMLDRKLEDWVRRMKLGTL